MKKTMRGFCLALVICLLIVTVSIIFSGCSRNPNGSPKSYKYAVVRLPNYGIVEGEIEDYGYLTRASTITVTIRGVKYLTHTSNVVLYTEKANRDPTSINNNAPNEESE